MRDAATISGKFSIPQKADNIYYKSLVSVNPLSQQILLLKISLKCIVVDIPEDLAI